MKRLSMIAVAVLLLMGAHLLVLSAAATIGHRPAVAVHATTVETLCVEGWLPDGTWHSCR